MGRTVIIGATSAIASEVSKLLAKRSETLFLVARDARKLEAVRRDLEIRGANVKGTFVADCNHFSQHQSVLFEAEKVLGAVDSLIVAHGSLGDQKAAEQSFDVALMEFNTNLLSVVSLLTVFANYFEEKRNGSIAVISSVAGDRGRKSNYIYGTAKGALNIFLQGLRNRLASSGVSVITIKPGFVDTPMTAQFKKNFLFAKPSRIALGIVNAIDKKKDCVCLPWFWRPIMWVIKLIPERIFKRLSL